MKELTVSFFCAVVGSTLSFSYNIIIHVTRVRFNILESIKHYLSIYLLASFFPCRSVLRVQFKINLISSLLHVLIHTGACAKAAYLLTYLFFNRNHW